MEEIYQNEGEKMLHAFSRSEMLLGKQGLDQLANSRVAIFGIGGVGSFAVEGLVRSGLGKFILVDEDEICLTNLNRQIHATGKTIGKPKVEVMRERILEINPKAEVVPWKRFYMANGVKTSSSLEPLKNELYWEEVLQFHQRPGQRIDYIIDAIDTVSAKLDLVTKAQKSGIDIISSMGAGNKLDPTKFEVSDLYKTQNCPLAKVMRKELRKRGVETLKVVYSQEEPMKPACSERRAIPGSVSFVPSVAGMIIAGEVVKDLIKKS